MKTKSEIGVQIPEILLPVNGIDHAKWAVIACDQFTSEPEYWKEVARIVGNTPSTYHMILPEVCLGTDEEAQRLETTQQTMEEYLEQGIFQTFQGMILVERQFAGKTRHGLMLALDLESYDFNKGSQTLIRATEGTILDRLPPRMKIRSGAALELPHILVLIDDPEFSVIEPLVENRSQFQALYDFDLMQGSGHLSGFGITSQDWQEKTLNALTRLANPNNFYPKYDVSEDHGVLLFAMGDGNHSLATAKAIWEKIKPEAGPNHPARYALVEIENVHDEGLEFEPIHRVLFDVKENHHLPLTQYFGGEIRFLSCTSSEALVLAVKQQKENSQTIGIISKDTLELAIITKPASNLPVGSLQPFLDNWKKSGGVEKIDYVHGEETVFRLGRQPGNLAFLLPAMPKSDLFKTVILDGSLPRKTFSMGEAKEKRFYMECRKIK